MQSQLVVLKSHVDDTILLAANGGEEMGLYINRYKTKVLVVDISGKLELTGTFHLKIVGNFMSLNSNINS